MHALVRFGFGAGPTDTPPADPRAWLKAQLRGPDPGLAAGAFAELPTGQAALDTIREDAIRRRAAAGEAALAGGGAPKPRPFAPRARQLLLDDAGTQLGFAAATAAPFRERLVWFWANHFSVSLLQGNTQSLVGPFVREAIRPHVTGRFADMVLAAERHPAMLRYLENEQSVGPGSLAGIALGKGLNENLGRECMELHTVGLEAGYTQADVTSMAKLLTGWSTATTAEGGGTPPTGFKYRHRAHEPGPQTVMGRSFPDGEAGGIAALRFLATYPTTYRRIARNLAAHFIADDPPAAAVAHLDGVLARTGGDLGAASAALVDLADAWTPLTKLKTPFDYVLSLLRSAPPAAAPRTELILGAMARLGQPLWAAPLPNGWSGRAEDWAAPDLVMGRIDAAYTYAGTYAATYAATYADSGPAPADAPADALAARALGPLLRPATRASMAGAGSPREAVALLFASPEFQRR